jgi:hypothetical protein
MPAQDEIRGVLLRDKTGQIDEARMENVSIRVWIHHKLAFVEFGMKIYETKLQVKTIKRKEMCSMCHWSYVEECRRPLV